MSGKQRPLISYYGGKQRMASKIIPFIPKHTVYVEPFCGGATILFKKPWPDASNTHHYREVINDSSEQLINMYRVFQTRFDEISHLIINTLHSESEHTKAINICKGQIEADELWKAWAYYVSVNTSFSNILNSGWGRGVFGTNLGSTWGNRLKQLDDYRNRMLDVTISCTDALKVIKQFDSPQTFFYCDPPYPNADQGHYDGYSQDDFNNLIQTLSACKGSAIVSCYSQDTPEGWARREFSSHCASSGKGQTNSDRSRAATTEEMGDRKRTEVILIKKSSQPRSEIQKLYDSGKYDCFTGDSIWEDNLGKEA